MLFSAARWNLNKCGMLSLLRSSALMQKPRGVSQKSSGVSLRRRTGFVRAELGQKVAARAFARSYLANLSELAFDQLEDSGHFVDPVEKEIQDSFIPWLFDSVVETTNNHISSSSCVDALIVDAIELASNLQSDVIKQIKQKERARVFAVEDAQEIKEAEGTAK